MNQQEETAKCVASFKDELAELKNRIEKLEAALPAAKAEGAKESAEWLAAQLMHADDAGSYFKKLFPLPARHNDDSGTTIYDACRSQNAKEGPCSLDVDALRNALAACERYRRAKERREPLHEIYPDHPETPGLLHSQFQAWLLQRQERDCEAAADLALHWTDPTLLTSDSVKLLREEFGRVPDIGSFTWEGDGWSCNYNPDQKGWELNGQFVGTLGRLRMAIVVAENE